MTHSISRIATCYIIKHTGCLVDLYDQRVLSDATIVRIFIIITRTDNVAGKSSPVTADCDLAHHIWSCSVLSSAQIIRPNPFFFFEKMNYNTRFAEYADFPWPNGLNSFGTGKYFPETRSSEYSTRCQCINIDTMKQTAAIHAKTAHKKCCQWFSWAFVGITDRLDLWRFRIVGESLK